jgi:hypothetical protein
MFFFALSKLFLKIYIRAIITIIIMIMKNDISHNNAKKNAEL